MNYIHRLNFCFCFRPLYFMKYICIHTYKASRKNVTLGVGFTLYSRIYWISVMLAYFPQLKSFLICFPKLTPACWIKLYFHVYFRPFLVIIKALGFSYGSETCAVSATFCTVDIIKHIFLYKFIGKYFTYLVIVIQMYPNLNGTKHS